MFPHIGFTQFLWTTKLFFCLEPQFPLFRVYIWKQISCTFVAFLWTVVLMSAAQLFIQKTVQGTCLCLEALIYFHLCWAKIFSLACLAAVVLAFYGSVQDSSPIIFLVAWILVRLDIHVPSSTLVLFLGALTGVVQRVLYRGDFLNHCSGVPSHYGPFSFPIAVHFDELIIALGLMFPCLFIDRMFALIRLW